MNVGLVLILDYTIALGFRWKSYHTLIIRNVPFHASCLHVWSFLFLLSFSFVRLILAHFPAGILRGPSGRRSHSCRSDQFRHSQLEMPKDEGRMQGYGKSVELLHLQIYSPSTSSLLLSLNIKITNFDSLSLQPKIALLGDCYSP